eukprot:379953-Lingulodinium_polyedra.AAC.1
MIGLQRGQLNRNDGTPGGFDINDLLAPTGLERARDRAGPRRLAGSLVGRGVAEPAVHGQPPSRGTAPAR